MKWFKRKPKEFVPPDLIKYTPLSNQDREIVSDLAFRLTKDGVIGEKIETMEASGSINEILSEAAAGARYEKDFNSAFYSPEVEAELQELEKVSETWNNPSLDGVDDYGRQIYASSLTPEERLRLSEDTEDEFDELMEDFKRNTDIA